MLMREFCKQHPQGFVVLEEKLRKSKEFREWLAGRSVLPTQ